MRQARAKQVLQRGEIAVVEGLRSAKLALLVATGASPSKASLALRIPEPKLVVFLSVVFHKGQQSVRDASRQADIKDNN